MLRCCALMYKPPLIPNSSSMCWACHLVARAEAVSLEVPDS